jgi:hypothetical protein
MVFFGRMFDVQLVPLRVISQQALTDVLQAKLIRGFGAGFGRNGVLYTKSTMKIYPTVVFCFLFVAQMAAQQVDTIHIDKQGLLTQNLKAAKSQYLVSVHSTDPARIRNLSLWTRELSLETRQGKEVIVVKQDWQGQDTLFNRSVYSVSEKVTFKPIYHYAKSPRGIEAYNFEAGRIIGADSVANNTRKTWQINYFRPYLRKNLQV